MGCVECVRVSVHAFRHVGVWCVCMCVCACVWTCVVVVCVCVCAAVSKAFTPLPRKCDRSDAEMGEHHESHALRFGKCL